MRRLLATALTCLALTVSGLAFGAIPAHAEGEPVISAVDVSTPGHAKGTVTTTSAYVGIGIRENGGNLAQTSTVQPVSGSVTFDFETWGLTSGTVWVIGCATPDSSACGEPVESVPFAPLDVTPEVIFPQDTTIGPGQDYAIDVTDSGGGRLLAVWIGGSTWLQHNGSTVLNLTADGQGQLVIHRCSSWEFGPCRETSVVHALTVNRTISAITSVAWNSAKPTVLEPTIRVDEDGPIALTWYINRVPDGSVVDGFGGEVTGLTPDVDGALHPSLDITGLGTGQYKLMGSVSQAIADFGTVTGNLAENLPGSLKFGVDVTPPVIGSVTLSANSLYPYKDGYRDAVKVSFPGNVGSTDVARLTVVRDSTGETVRTLTTNCCNNAYTVTWGGRLSFDVPAPAGTYSLTVSLTDLAGNKARKFAGRVTVVRKKTSAHTLLRSLSAAGSKVDQSVGRCSTLRRPSLRGWAGSLGLYTNTKCRDTFKAGLIVTVHASRAPLGAVKYGKLRIDAYGGAAKAAPRSLAYLDYLQRSKEWLSASRMDPRVGIQDGLTVEGAKFVFDDRFMVWRLYTAKGAKYDIKSFKITLRYFTLVPE
jgi:hypothetical protein